MIFLQVFTDVVDALLGADPFTEILFVVFTDVCAEFEFDELEDIFGDEKVFKARFALLVHYVLNDSFVAVEFKHGWNFGLEKFLLCFGLICDVQWLLKFFGYVVVNAQCVSVLGENLALK